MTDTANHSKNRVKLILVDEIPEDLLALCIPNVDSLFDDYDQDIIRGMCERNLVYKLSDQSVVYTNPQTDIMDIYFKDVTKVNSPQLLLLLAKFPNARVVLFLTSESEHLSKSDSFLSIYETNYDELNVETRRIKSNVSHKSVPDLSDIIIDAHEVVEMFKNEMNEILLGSHLG